jgi:hypothetical protein
MGHPCLAQTQFEMGGVFILKWEVCNLSSASDVVVNRLQQKETHFETFHQIQNGKQSKQQLNYLTNT